MKRICWVLLVGLVGLAPRGPAHANDTSAAPATAAAFKEIQATPGLLGELRKGGYVLYMRHGQTDNTKPDRYPTIDLNDCSTQRPLSAGGMNMAREIGKAVRAASLPLADIHISPLCRVRDTVAAAFPGQAFTVDNALMYTANLTEEEKQPIVANTRRLLSTPVRPGANRLLVGHAPNLMDLIGYFPKEGTLVIFRPRGDGQFEYLGSIPPALWHSLH